MTGLIYQTFYMNNQTPSEEIVIYGLYQSQFVRRIAFGTNTNLWTG
jgi:hypothetical protein